MKDKQIERLKRKCVIHHCEGKYLIRQHPRSHICRFFFTLNEEIEMKGGQFWGCAASVGRIRYWDSVGEGQPSWPMKGLQAELFFCCNFSALPSCSSNCRREQWGRISIFFFFLFFLQLLTSVLLHCAAHSRKDNLIWNEILFVQRNS